MKEKKVIVRSFGGIPLIRDLFSSIDRVIYLTFP
jgi:hypothetical protein